MLSTVVAVLWFLGAGPHTGKVPSKRAEWPAGKPTPNLTGFWKTDCHDNFGVKIEPTGGDLYSLSFCGPGGCFAPGTWRPNSPIFGDKAYGVISADAIQLPFGDGFLTYHRCLSQTAEPSEPSKDTAAAALSTEALPGIRYKAYYQGLPNIDEAPPFASQSAEQAGSLHLLVQQARGVSGSCARPAQPVPGARELCGQTLAKVRQLLKVASHRLPAGGFSRMWLVDLKGDGARGLLVQYDAKAKGEQDRYAAFFSFGWDTRRYRVTAASWFLEGSLHAVRLFGPTNTKKAFFRYLSCTECDASVYLTVVDFTVPPTGAGYQFGYNLEDRQSRGPEIEYSLPGMGHTIDAEVETRIPTQPGPAGPHLLQHFIVEDGPDEWWSFTCHGLECDAGMTKGQPSVQMADQWKKALTL